MDTELPDKSKIKLIATDLDGTLLTAKGRISEKTKTVITEILAKYPDLHFVIATARPRPATVRIRNELGILKRPNAESINSNGTIAYDSRGNILFQNTLPTEYIMKFHKILQSYPKATYRYTYGDHFVTYSQKWANKEKDLTQDSAFMEGREHIRKIASGEEESNINNVAFIFKGTNWEEILVKLEELKEEYNLSSSKTSYLIEYMPNQSNKGTGLARLLQQLNISKDEVIAFGDGSNDIEMLQTVGWPVAVENAVEELKSLAKIITKTNRENGVADILEKIFLNE